MSKSLASLSAQVSGLDSDAQAALDAALGRPIPARFKPPGAIDDDEDVEGVGDLRNSASTNRACKRGESPTKKPKMTGETGPPEDELMQPLNTEVLDDTLTPLSQKMTQPWLVDVHGKPTGESNNKMPPGHAEDHGQKGGLHQVDTQGMNSGIHTLPEIPSHVEHENSSPEGPSRVKPNDHSPVFGRPGTLHPPPVFAGGTSNPAVSPHGAQHFHLDEPSWLPSLKAGIQELKDKQEQILAVADNNSRELCSLQHKVEDAVPRVEAVESLTHEHTREIRELRHEVQALRSRSVSPAPGVVGQGPGASSPTSPRQGPRYDDLQI